jgi:dTMP kinase
MRGLFVTFEGTEGSGKSTQLNLLAKRLSAQSREVITLREPGGTPLGEAIRQILKHGVRNISAEAELLLVNASRAQLVREVIRPALCAGKIVLCDRFFDSTIAYQVFGRGLNDVQAERIINFAVDGTIPDLTLLLRVPLDVSEERRRARGNELQLSGSGPAEDQAQDRFEAENREFFKRVEKGYDAIASSTGAAGDRVRAIDATRSVEEVAEEVWRWVEQLLAVPPEQGERAWKTIGEYRMAAPGSD